MGDLQLGVHSGLSNLTERGIHSWCFFGHFLHHL